MTKSRGINRPKAAWTDAMLALLVKDYSEVDSAQIAKQLGLSLNQVYAKAFKLGLKKSKDYLRAKVYIFNQPEKSIATQIKKGNTPGNKGTKGLLLGGVETQFKKGQKSHNWKPIGSERLLDGYVQVKVSDTGYPPRDWKPKHRLVYEAAHGAILPGHVVVFKNGNRLDIRLENLELLTLAQNALRNTLHRYPPEIVIAIRTRGLITRQINKLRKESNHE